MNRKRFQLNHEVIELENPIPPLPKEKVVVRFKYNTNDFTEAGFETLKTFAKILAMYPETKILISGYTDSEGYKKYNRKLSEFRAKMKIKGLRNENPIESNNTINACGEYSNCSGSKEPGQTGSVKQEPVLVDT